MKVLWTLALIVLVAACGSPAASRATPSLTVASTGRSSGVSPSASTAASALIVVSLPAPTAAATSTLLLFHEDGTSAGKLTLAPGSTVVAVAGRRIFVRTSDERLVALLPDGSSTQLEPPGSLGWTAMASPDGSQWIWLVQTSDTTSLAIYLGGDGIAPRKIATITAGMSPYAWTSRGILLDSGPLDFLGYRAFNTAWEAGGGMQLLDPSTGTLTPFTQPGCTFSDEGPDGRIACFPTKPSYLIPTLHTLRIIDPSGKSNDLGLSVPRFNDIGDAYFSPDESLLTVAGATGAAAPPGGPGTTSTKPEQYGTDLVTVSTTGIVRFGPTGTRPAMGRESWLPDGQLVLWRPDTYGGAAGLYVLNPHGSGAGSEIVVSGTPLGYVTG